MTDDNIKRGLTSRRNLEQKDFDDDFEVEVNSVIDGYLTKRPASMTDMRRGLDAAGVRSGDVAEVWVSPDGSDDNPGTRSAPFASIQYAIDTLVERVGDSESKVVRLLHGIYDLDSPIIDYTKNIKIIGPGNSHAGQSEPAAEVSLSSVMIRRDDFGPVMVKTNMTKEAYNNYVLEGGFDYSVDEEGYEYTGALLDNRELSYDGQAFGNEWVNTEINNIHLQGGFYMLGASSDNDNVDLRGIFLKSVFQTGQMFCKNIRSLSCEDLRLSAFNANHVFDEIGSIFLGYTKPTTVDQLTSAINQTNTWVINGDCSLGVNTQGKLGFNMSKFGGNFNLYGATLGMDLEVNQNAEIDFTGVTVLGDVDLTGAGDVTWRGGSFYGTLTDPDNKLGGAAAGSYLNVSA